MSTADDMKRRLVGALKRHAAKVTKRTGRKHKPTLAIAPSGKARAYAVPVDEAGKPERHDPLLFELGYDGDPPRTVKRDRRRRRGGPP
jgi:hypothetical protein